MANIKARYELSRAARAEIAEHEIHMRYAWEALKNLNYSSAETWINAAIEDLTKATMKLPKES